MLEANPRDKCHTKSEIKEPFIGDGENDEGRCEC